MFTDDFIKLLDGNSATWYFLNPMLRIMKIKKKVLYHSFNLKKLHRVIKTSQKNLFKAIY